MATPLGGPESEVDRPVQAEARADFSSTEDSTEMFGVSRHSTRVLLPASPKPPPTSRKVSSRRYGPALSDPVSILPPPKPSEPRPKEVPACLQTVSGARIRRLEGSASVYETYHTEGVGPFPAQLPLKLQQQNRLPTPAHRANINREDSRGV